MPKKPPLPWPLLRKIPNAQPSRLNAWAEILAESQLPKEFIPVLAHAFRTRLAQLEGLGQRIYCDQAEVLLADLEMREQEDQAATKELPQTFTVVTYSNGSNGQQVITVSRTRHFLIG